MILGQLRIGARSTTYAALYPTRPDIEKPYPLGTDYITLSVIDIHYDRCLEPFPPLYDHFEIWRFLVPNWQN